MGLILAAFLVFGLVMIAMAVGVIFSNRAIKGSCGGLGALSARIGLPLCECGGDPDKCKMNREGPGVQDGSGAKEEDFLLRS